MCFKLFFLKFTRSVKALFKVIHRVIHIIHRLNCNFIFFFSDKHNILYYYKFVNLLFLYCNILQILNVLFCLIFLVFLLFLYILFFLFSTFIFFNFVTLIFQSIYFYLFFQVYILKSYPQKAVDNFVFLLKNGTKIFYDINSLENLSSA